MKTKNLVLFIIGIVVITTTFDLSIMSVLVHRLLLLTLVIVGVISSKWFKTNPQHALFYRGWALQVLTIQNLLIYATWCLQITTIWIFCNEIDSYILIEYRLPYGYFIFWGIITTIVIIAIIYFVNRWIKDEWEKPISIIWMILIGATGIMIMLCSRIENDLAKESWYLLSAMAVIQWIIFTVTFHFRMRNAHLNKYINK